MKKVINIVTTAFLVLVLFIAAALVGVRLFGIAPYTVLSGSMEPTYHVGSLIYVKDISPEDLKVGDSITYVIAGETIVTHRIIEIIPNYGDNGELGFKTKGDANKTEDGTPVHANNVIGKPIFTIPYLGYMAYFIQTPPMSYIAVGLCVFMLSMTFLPDLVDKIAGAETEAKDKKPSDESAAQSVTNAEVAAEIEELKRLVAEQEAKARGEDEPESEAESLT